MYFDQRIIDQNLVNAFKAVHKEKFIPLSTPVRKDQLKIDDLSFHLKKPEEEQQIKSKESGGK